MTSRGLRYARTAVLPFRVRPSPLRGPRQGRPCPRGRWGRPAALRASVNGRASPPRGRSGLSPSGRAGGGERGRWGGVRRLRASGSGGSAAACPAGCRRDTGLRAGARAAGGDGAEALPRSFAAHRCPGVTLLFPFPPSAFPL